MSDDHTTPTQIQPIDTTALDGQPDPPAVQALEALGNAALTRLRAERTEV